MCFGHMQAYPLLPNTNLPQLRTGMLESVNGMRYTKLKAYTVFCTMLCNFTIKHEAVITTYV